jgi:hypothetical protein
LLHLDASNSNINNHQGASAVPDGCIIDRFFRELASNTSKNNNDQSNDLFCHGIPSIMRTDFSLYLHDAMHHAYSTDIRLNQTASKIHIDIDFSIRTVPVQHVPSRKKLPSIPRTVVSRAVLHVRCHHEIPVHDNKLSLALPSSTPRAATATATKKDCDLTTSISKFDRWKQEVQLLRNAQTPKNEMNLIRDVPPPMQSQIQTPASKDTSKVQEKDELGHIETSQSMQPPFAVDKIYNNLKKENQLDSKPCVDERNELDKGHTHDLTLSANQQNNDPTRNATRKKNFQSEALLVPSDDDSMSEDCTARLPFRNILGESDLRSMTSAITTPASLLRGHTDETTENNLPQKRDKAVKSKALQQEWIQGTVLNRGIHTRARALLHENEELDDTKRRDIVEHVTNRNKANTIERNQPPKTGDGNLECTPSNPPLDEPSVQDASLLLPTAKIAFDHSTSDRDSNDNGSSWDWMLHTCHTWNAKSIADGVLHVADQVRNNTTVRDISYVLEEKAQKFARSYTNFTGSSDGAVAASSGSDRDSLKTTNESQSNDRSNENDGEEELNDFFAYRPQLSQMSYKSMVKNRLEEIQHTTNNYSKVNGIRAIEGFEVQQRQVTSPQNSGNDSTASMSSSESDRREVLRQRTEHGKQISMPLLSKASLKLPNRADGESKKKVPLHAPSPKKKVAFNNKEPPDDRVHETRYIPDASHETRGKFDSKPEREMLKGKVGPGIKKIFHRRKNGLADF